MALPRRARVLRDRHLSHGEALDADKRGPEPVHTLEKFEPFSALSLKSTETTGRIADLLAADLVPHAVGNPGGDHAQYIIALRTSDDARTAGTIELDPGIELLWEVFG